MSFSDCQTPLDYFKELCRVPHGSGNEKALSDRILSFARELGLWAEQDEHYNVLVKKPASKGREGSDPVLLQAHIDMVCDKRGDVVFDFNADPLNVKIEGDFIKADGTSLGADNGAGEAIMLAALAGDYDHPPIEALFTVDEEIGMTGAKKLDAANIRSRRVINLDSENDDVIIAGCSGGALSLIKIRTTTFPANGLARARMEINGLRGGHSGINIKDGRANANILAARALSKLIEETGASFYGLNGGSKDNAIPRECSAFIYFPKEREEAVRGVLSRAEERFSKEFREDKDVKINFELAPAGDEDEALAFTEETAEKVLASILLPPNGVIDMRGDFVETSCNVGVARTENGLFTATLAPRSSVNSKIGFITDKLRLLAKTLGGELEVYNEYPSWEYRENSPLRDTAAVAYKDLYGEEPSAEIIHAGLECAVFGEKLENADMISLGPNITGAHSPDERLSLSSLERTWEYTLELLKRL
ncbi:MAG: beta-Ala-His dipeptidase [Clostridiales bacterium]|jgi:dipeptidase D|nr:beta-Ala-His dipeptidase [Clostridiales bacterium]